MRFVLYFTICVTIIALGESLRCYNCVDVDEAEFPGMLKCIKPFSSNDNNAKCTDGGACMKGIGSMDSLTVTVRQCIPLGNIPNGNANLPSELSNPIEMQFGTVRVTAHLCNTDLCNGASLPITTISFIILSLATVFFI